MPPGATDTICLFEHDKVGNASLTQLNAGANAAGACPDDDYSMPLSLLDYYP